MPNKSPNKGFYVCVCAWGCNKSQTKLVDRFFIDQATQFGYAFVTNCIQIISV